MKMEELKSLIASAGVVGAGGAGFPTAFKLRDGIDSLVINAAECEPLIYTDYYLLKNEDVYKRQAPKTSRPKR